MKKILSLVLCISMILSAFAFNAVAEGEDDVVALEFTEKIFECQLITDFQYTLIRNFEELENFLLICDNEYGNNEFVKYASTLPDDYFDEKAIFVASHISESGATYKIDRIYVEAGSVYMEYTYLNAWEKPLDIVTYLITAEVNQKDIESVEYLRALLTLKSEDDISFDYHYFGGGEWKENDDAFHGKGVSPTLVQNFDELNEFVASVSDTSSASFGEYASALPESFFEENALLLVQVFSSEGGYEYCVTSLEASEYGLMLGYSYSAFECYEVLSSAVIAVEFKKSDAKNLETVRSSKVFDAMMVYIDYSVLKPESAIVGDINGDYTVDADDYILLKRIYFGTSKYTSFGDKTEMRSDVDGNGVVNADDYILLKRACFGLYTIG